MNFRPEIQLWKLSLAVVMAVLTTTFTVACNTTENQSSVPAVPAAILTATQANPSPTAFSRWAYATEYARREALYATAVALTPGTKNARPPGTPLPTATIELGLFPGGCGARKNSRDLWTISCWRGLLNGQIVQMESGRYGSESDGSQGLLVVNVWPDDHWTDENQIIYNTPQRVGPVRIVSVDAMRVTLATYDPWATQTPQPSTTPQITFVFDLSTRQWVSPPPLPTPSVSVPPLPTLSPSLSPIPSVPPLP